MTESKRWYAILEHANNRLYSNNNLLVKEIENNIKKRILLNDPKRHSGLIEYTLVQKELKSLLRWIRSAQKTGMILGDKK